MKKGPIKLYPKFLKQLQLFEKILKLKGRKLSRSWFEVNTTSTDTDELTMNNTYLNVNISVSQKPVKKKLLIFFFKRKMLNYYSSQVTVDQEAEDLVLEVEVGLEKE